MSTWLVVWLVIGLVSTAAVIACVIALGRHVLILGRTARRVSDELGPIARELSAQSRRAAERAGSLGMPERPDRRRHRK